MNYDPVSSVPVIDLPLIGLPQVVQPPPGSIMLKIPALPKTPPSLKRVRRVEDPLVVPEDSPTKKKKKGHYCTYSFMAHDGYPIIEATCFKISV